MTIRIVPQQQLSEQSNTLSQSKAVGSIPLLFFPNDKTIYRLRTKRLHSLIADNPFGEYLTFITALVNAQDAATQQLPLTISIDDLIAQAHQHDRLVLDRVHLVKDDHWQQLLDQLIHTLLSQTAYTLSPQITETLQQLLALSHAERSQLAESLLALNLQQVKPDYALFLWSALSVYWTQLASQIHGIQAKDYGNDQACCPICGSHPVASVVHIGKEQGLRYLHCSLCETEWHYVRIKCTNCAHSGKLDYWSLDDVQTTAIKAESCSDCQSYLKVFYQEKTPHLDVIADDLASLMLDVKLEEKGIAKSGFNPFVFSN